MKCMTAPTHDCFHPYFVHCIEASGELNGITADQSRAFKVTVGNDVSNFIGRFSGSLKRGDILVTPSASLTLTHALDSDSSDDDHDDDDDEDMSVDHPQAYQPRTDPSIPNDGFPTIAVEVGFSESYSALLRDMSLWLHGAAGRVRVVIIVNLVETPPVNLQPLVLANDDLFEHDVTPPQMIRFHRGSRYGPLLYHGHVLVGAITGTLELWRLDPVSQEPYMETRKVVVSPPPPPSLLLSLTDKDCATLARWNC